MCNELNKALIEAAKIDNETIVKLLLAAGADVHTHDDYALRLASMNGHPEVVKLLIAAGADVNAYEGWALMLASERGYLEIVKLLIDAGADLHAKDDYALRWASQNGHSEVVKLLEASMKPRTVTLELTDEQLEKIKKLLETA